MGLLYRLLNRDGKYLSNEASKALACAIPNSSSALVCESPKKSLRFAHTGNVMGCCYNREYVLGKYPKDSIRSIWNGQKRNALNKALKYNDFGKGCSACHQALENNNFHNSGAAQYNYLRNYPNSKYPTMLDFEIGSTCNLECIMCNGEYSSTIRKNREGCSPYEEIYDDGFVQQLREFIPHLLEARFVGGEPFLVKIHYPIWNAIYELNPKCKISILTNGTVWNKSVEEFFRKGNVHISFSIDSINPEEYSIIRKRGHLSKVLNNFNAVRLMSAELGRSVVVNICVMRQNLHSIAETIKYFDNCDVEISLHEVEYPFHTSIWNWTIVEINSLKNNLSNMKLTGECSKNNQQKVDSMINGLTAMIQIVPFLQEKRNQMEKLDYCSVKRLFIENISTAKKSHLGKRVENILTLTENEMHENLLKKVLVEMLLFPQERLVGEVENLSDDRLKMKFKHAFG